MPKPLHVEHVRQQLPNGCLAACAQMALQAIGIERSQSELNILLGLTEIGTPSVRIERLSTLGVEVTYSVGNADTIRATVERGLPTIVFVMTGELPYWQSNVGHAIVVGGYTDDTVVIYDPAFSSGPHRVTWEDFLLAWSEFDYKYAVVARR